MKTLSLVLGSLLVALISVQANAAIVTKYGTDVKFTYDDSSLFGDANVVGNNIFFLPTTFSAESLNGNGGEATVSTNQTLVVTIEATTIGYNMEQFVLVEQGDYFLSGEDSSVTAGGQLRITSNTQECLRTDLPFPVTSLCTEADTFTVDPMTVQNAYTDWDVFAEVDLSDRADWLSDTSVEMTLENRLTATSFDNGDQAFIEKKFAGVGITVIPVPAAVWLFGSALAGMFGWARRRSMLA